MKNRLKKLLYILILVFIPFISVSAKEITTLDVSENNGVITVKGTAEAGTLAVAIMVYDSSEANLITMKTTSVASDNSYKDTLEVAPGNYVVKVADYDGGDYKIKSISSSKEQLSSKENNPQTGDKAMLYIIGLIASLIGLISVILHLKKIKKAS